MNKFITNKAALKFFKTVNSEGLSPLALREALNKAGLEWLYDIETLNNTIDKAVKLKDCKIICEEKQIKI